MKISTLETTHPALEIRDLTKRYDKLVAVDNLTLRIGRGEIFGLLGPNGSGKTTTVSMVTGLLKQDSGSVNVLGLDLVHSRRGVLSKLGMVPQETALYEELTAYENLSFHADLYRVPPREKDERIKKLLELILLWDRRNDRVSGYSGGMKRRLAIARALLHEPEIVVLDEPTLGVDVQSRRAIWDFVKKLPSEGRTVLLTTNYLDEANALADRVVILDHGRVVAQGRPEELKAAYGTTVIEVTTNSPIAESSVATIRGLSGVLSVELSGDRDRLLVYVTGERTLASVIQSVTSQLQMKDISVHPPALDDVFLKLTGKEVRD
jgi:daunorubicin resistance ABC transporter ATP-binding subunit